MNITRIFVRQPIIPDREQVDTEALCPPHDFESAWTTPVDSAHHDDTVPALFCRSCGSIRAFKIPSDFG